MLTYLAAGPKTRTIPVVGVLFTAHRSRRPRSSTSALRITNSTMDAGDWRGMIADICAEKTLEAAGRAAGYGDDKSAVAVALDRLRRAASDR